MKRIAISLILTVTVALLFWGMALYFTARDAEIYSNLYAARVEKVADTVREDLKRLAAMPGTIDLDVNAISKEFAAVAAGNPIYLTIGLSDWDGNSIFSTYRQKPGTTLRDRKYFNDTVAKRDFVAGEFVRGKMSGRGVFHFSYPVTAQNGEFRGTINISIDLLSMGLSLALQDLPEGSLFDLFDHSGIIISTNREPKQRTGKSIPKTDFEWLKSLKGKETRLVYREGWSRWFTTGRQIRLPDGSCYAYLKIDLPAGKPEERAFTVFSWLLVFAGSVFLISRIRRTVNASRSGQVRK